MRSIIGEYIHRTDRPAGRRLVMSQPKTINRYNKTEEEQFKIHRTEKRMNIVYNHTRFSGRPGPMWLGSIIIKPYKQME
jgi:hypothetical protein